MGQSLLEPAVTPAKPSRLQQTKVLGEAAQAAAFATPAPEQVSPLGCRTTTTTATTTVLATCGRLRDR